MFFIFGIYPKEKPLAYEYNRLDIHSCGRYAKIDIIMVYYTASIFFVPLFKFDKKYYARYTCCGKTYELDKNIGKSIERGENPPLNFDDGKKVDMDYQEVHICTRCHRKLEEDFEYCPYCGEKIKGEI